MICISPIFSSHNLCYGKEKVRITNGSLSPMLGKESIYVTPFMTLSYVLHVPDFVANLLSITRINLELNCRVNFYSHYCFFKDLVTRRMIVNGSWRDDLYYLDSQPRIQGWLTHA